MMKSQVDHHQETKQFLIQQLVNVRLKDQSVAEILSCFEPNFLHDMAIKLKLNDTCHVVFVNHFSIENKDQDVNEIARHLDITPQVYRDNLEVIYQRFARVNSFELRDQYKSQQIYHKLWNYDFYQWFNIKDCSLLCRRSNDERRKSWLKTDRRQNLRGRLITDFKLQCVKGKLDRLQAIYDLSSYSFIEELKKTLIQAINKYKFKDKLTQNLSDPNEIIEQAILTIREKVKFQGQSDLESTEYNYLNAIINSLNPLLNRLSLSIIGSPQLKQEITYINKNLEESLVMLEQYRNYHQASKHNSGKYITLITLLENIRDLILDKYDVVILDRRKQANRKSKS